MEALTEWCFREWDTWGPSEMIQGIGRWIRAWHCDFHRLTLGWEWRTRVSLASWLSGEKSSKPGLWSAQHLTHHLPLSQSGQHQIYLIIAWLPWTKSAWPRGTRVWYCAALGRRGQGFLSWFWLDWSHLDVIIASQMRPWVPAVDRCRLIFVDWS
jgi:hypothetical protein